MESLFFGVAGLGLIGGIWYWIRRSRGRALASDATAGYLMADHVATSSFSTHGYHGDSGCGDVGAGGAGCDSGGVSV